MDVLKVFEHAIHEPARTECDDSEKFSRRVEVGLTFYVGNAAESELHLYSNRGSWLGPAKSFSLE